jgi:HEAT repeat protein
MTVRGVTACAVVLFGVSAATAQLKDPPAPQKDPFALPKDDLSDARDLELRRRLEPLVPSIRSALQGTNADAQRAALAVVADFPPALLFQANLSGAVAGFLEREQTDPELTALAIRSFGKTYPEKPDAATRILRRYAGSDNVAVRRAVADALTNLVQTSTPSTRSVENSTAFIDVATATLPLVAEVLADKDPEVQRTVMGGVQTAAQVVRDLYVFDTGPIGEEAKPKDRAERLQPLMPVIRGLAGVVPNLSHPLTSPDPQTRIATARTIELLAAMRREIARGPVSPAGRVADPTAEGWATLRDVIAERMQDEDPAVRLAVTEALESLGDAIEARRLLRVATADRNVFVRWAAARALGKAAPAKPDPAAVADDVSALAHLTADPDIDTRMAALNALARYGSAARSATPAVLTAASRGDIEPRVVAVRTAGALETEAALTIPVLIEGLRNPDVRLRTAAASGLVRFGSDARPALSELRRAVLSTDPQLRLAAAEAVLAIERPVRLKDL